MKALKDEDWLLLTRAVKEEISESERDTFNQWLQSDRNRQAVYEKMKADWEQSGKLPIADHPNPELVWNAITTQINAQSDKVIPLRQHWLRYAAAIALLVLGSIWLIKEFSNPVQTIASTEANTLIQLPDGSNISLDKGATLQYQNFDDLDSRQVTLTGQGYFEIARDESKPFKVKVGRAQVEVLGTAFNINARNLEKITVSVTHGKVAFGDQSDQIILTKGESGLLTESELMRSSIADDNFLSWKTGILKFEDATIAEVCETLKDYYQSEISANEGIDPSVRLTATFDNQTLAEVAEIIAITLDLDLIETESGLELQQSKSSN